MRFLSLGAAVLLLSSCEVKFDWPWLKESAHASGKTVTEDRAIGPFDSVRLDGIGKLVFDAAIPSGTIRVTADEAVLPFLQTKVEENKLSIDENDIKLGMNLGAWDVEFRVAPPAKLSSITLDGMGSIEGTALTTSAALQVELGGMGKIELEVETPELTARQSGQGELVVRGKAGKVVISADGLGKVDASELITANAEVTSNGVGEVIVYASETLKVRADGLGAVRFKGHPKSTDVQTEGLTKVKASD